MKDELFILFDEMRIYKIYSESFANSARSNNQTIESLKKLRTNINSHTNFIAKKFGLLEELDIEIQNDTNQTLDIATSLLENIQLLSLPENGNNNFSIQATIETDVSSLNKSIIEVTNRANKLTSIANAVARKAEIQELKSLAKNLGLRIIKNTVLGSEALTVGLTISLVADIYDAIDIGTSICETLYRQYSVSTTLSNIKNLVTITVPIIEGIKADRCLRNTGILELQNNTTKNLDESFNFILVGLQNYISAINHKGDSGDNTQINNSKSILDARISGYQTLVIPQAQSVLNDKCKDDPNESNCIKVARKTFNQLGEAKPILIQPTGVNNCFTYRSGRVSPQNFTASMGDINVNGLLLGVSTSSKNSGRQSRIIDIYKLKTNTYSTLYAFFDRMKDSHISIRPNISNVKSSVLDEWGTVIINGNSLSRKVELDNWLKKYQKDYRNTLDPDGTPINNSYGWVSFDWTKYYQYKGNNQDFINLSNLLHKYTMSFAYSDSGSIN